MDKFQAAVTPHLENAKGAVVPHIEKAREVVTPHLEAVGKKFDEAKTAVVPHLEAAGKKFDEAKAAAAPHIEAAGKKLEEVKGHVSVHIEKAGKSLQETIEKAPEYSRELVDKIPKKVEVHPVGISVWKNILNFILRKKVGQIWDSSKAFRAYHQGKLASKTPSSHPVRVCFRNLTDDPIVVCWINYEGGPEMYVEVPPQAMPKSPFHANEITELDVIQNVTLGDTFCFISCDDAEEAEAEQDFDDMIGAYRPLELGVSVQEEEAVIHLVTIEEQHAWFLKPCKPSDKIVTEDDEDDTDVKQFTLHSRLVMLDMAPLDTSDKVYISVEIGGWPCFVEEGWDGGDEALLERITTDIEAAKSALPEEVSSELMKTTPIYINRTMSYGPAACPVAGSGMRFHSSEEWIEQMGLSPTKIGAIELFEAAEYTDDCDDWGTGGVFLRMMATAYHFKMIANGYGNEEIDLCYKRAMKQTLYDSVVVKTDGIEAESKAFAAISPAAYFSELSTAFLGGLDKDVKFNKWQPFNCEEIKTFDPRAFKMLQKMWGIDLDGKPKTTKTAPAGGTRKKKPLTSTKTDEAEVEPSPEAEAQAEIEPEPETEQ